MFDADGFLLTTQRQIPNLARIPGVLTHCAYLRAVGLDLEFEGLQAFHRRMIRDSITHGAKTMDACGVRALHPRSEGRGFLRKIG